MSGMAMQVKAAAELQMAPLPLPPECILDGDPVALAHIMVQSPDRRQSSGIWECTAGKFDFTFPWHEMFRVLEGEVTIEDETGARYTLHAGDFAHFPLGLKTTWTIERHVKKVFFLVTPEPLEL
jgi:hypothetical protein